MPASRETLACARVGRNPRNATTFGFCYSPPMRWFTLFPSPIGTCGIGWSERGISAFQLPARSEDATRALLLRAMPEADAADPPPPVAEAIRRIVALFEGARDDLSDIAVDLDGVAPFERAVYDVARKIPPGSTLTYGAVASRIGAPDAARAVGAALGRNPVAVIVPCHRVLAAGGADGGFSAPGGVATKRRLLEIEGALTPQPSLFP